MTKFHFGSHTGSFKSHPNHTRPTKKRKEKKRKKQPEPQTQLGHNSLHRFFVIVVDKFSVQDY